MAEDRFDVLIIGSGFAGAATAFHLSRVFEGSILLVEREEVPGVHASGRNASLILQSVADPILRQTLVASRVEYERLEAQVGFRRVGSLLLGSRDRLEDVREPDRVASRFRSREHVRRRVPLVEGLDFEEALETPSDGVIDIWALLQHYIAGARSRGVTTLNRCEVQEISDGSPFRVQTSRGSIRATRLINAAGAWATRLAAMAGAADLPLVAWKRHLVAMRGLQSVDPEWPFVWSLQPEFYFRTDAAGLLFSICDEERSSSLVPTVSPDIPERVAELVWKQLPALRAATQRDVWSCFRTKSPDGRFVIGWDPQRAGFFWVAALGGHGVGSSWEVGRLAAAAFTGREISPGDAMAPARLRDA